VAFLACAVVFDQFPRIVTDHCGNAVPRGADRFDGWIVFHDDSVAPSNSRAGQRFSGSARLVVEAKCSCLDVNATIHGALWLKVRFQATTDFTCGIPAFRRPISLSHRIAIP
jgi:hypothetical protein